MKYSKKNRVRIFIVTNLIIFLFIILLFSIMQFVRGQAKIKIDSMKAYNSLTGNFSLKYPGNWYAIDTPDGSRGDTYVVSVIMYNETESNIGILVARKSFPNNHLGDVIKWGIEREKANSYSEIECKNLTINDNNGSICEYTIKPPSLVNNFSLHCINWYTIYDLNGYIFKLCSNEKSWDTIEKTFYDIISSIIFN